MAFGIVIKMENGWGFKTPNSGVLRDLETDIEYPFRRPTLVLTSTSGKVPKWNVGLYDGVSFTIEDGRAEDVTLVRKYHKGSTFGITTT